MTYYLTAITARPSDKPVRHALDASMPKYSRTGKTYKAVCTAQVRIVIVESWDPTNERACPDCVEALA